MAVRRRHAAEPAESFSGPATETAESATLALCRMTLLALFEGEYAKEDTSEADTRRSRAYA